MRVTPVKPPGPSPTSPNLILVILRRRPITMERVKVKFVAAFGYRYYFLALY